MFKFLHGAVDRVLQEDYDALKREMSRSPELEFLIEGDLSCAVKCAKRDSGYLDHIDPRIMSREVEEEINNETEKMEKHAIIQEICSKCGHPELYFYTMQLRSVDEGSTVFYECPKCKHKFSQNN